MVGKFILDDYAIVSETPLADHDCLHVIFFLSILNHCSKLVVDASSESAIKSEKHSPLIKAHSSDMAPIYILPQLKRSEYETEPPMVKIMRMTEYELENVKDFAIKNKNGKIHFEGYTDLRGLDLDEIVTIENKTVNLTIILFIENLFLFSLS